MLISIITVNYNDAEGLEKTIKSVQSQTYRDFEHIIIDGNSTDGSNAVIEKNKDSFSYWLSEPDTGIYNAMNKGIKVAKGKYLLFLNSGDWLYNDKVLERVSENMRGDLDIYYGNLILDNGKGNQKNINPPKKLTFSYLLKYTIPHQSAFIKTALLKKNPYNENLKIVSDWEFFIIQIVKNNASYRYIDTIISYYDTNGISSNPKHGNLFKTERQKSLQQHFSFFVSDYSELKKYRNILQSNRFKILLELEKSKIAQKINSVILRVLLLVFRGKKLRDL